MDRRHRGISLCLLFSDGPGGIAVSAFVCCFQMDLNGNIAYWQFLHSSRRPDSLPADRTPRLLVTEA
jgi:hypothetical protein